mgnify:CR=1 FL=1
MHKRRSVGGESALQTFLSASACNLSPPHSPVPVLRMCLLQQPTGHSAGFNGFCCVYGGIKEFLSFSLSFLSKLPSVLKGVVTAVVVLCPAKLPLVAHPMSPLLVHLPLSVCRPFACCAEIGLLSSCDGNLLTSFQFHFTSSNPRWSECAKAARVNAVKLICLHTASPAYCVGSECALIRTNGDHQIIIII